MTSHETNTDPPELFKSFNGTQIAMALLSCESREDLILEELLLWPPDLFAFTSFIFSITGAYHMVISPPNDPSVTWPPSDNWSDEVRRIGFEWRTKLAGYSTKVSSDDIEKESGLFSSNKLEECKKLAPPEKKELVYRLVGECNPLSPTAGDLWVPQEVREHFAELCSHMQPRDSLIDLFDDWRGLALMMTLHAIADEACVGWGIREIPFLKANGEYKPDTSLIGKVTKSEAATFAAKQLQKFGTMATFNPLRGRVLPKRHTPGVGITLRSMSSNLAFHRSSVEVEWRDADSNENLLTTRLTTSENKIFSVLLLPWPDKVSAKDFKPVHNNHRLKMDTGFQFFKYSPASHPDDLFHSNLTRALRSAQNEIAEIDIVVLPECALDENQISLFESIIGDQKFNVSAYVAGVRGPEGTGDDVFTDNMVYFKIGETDNRRKGKRKTVYLPNMDEDNVQYKHHRWRMDKFQIQNYNLGHALSPHKNWWESIKIRRRKVTFVNVGNELTICPLICEDLSRQDPIADLIRTVGPSLVITILLDGPQKKDRWSARYASVLSEDPGCAVITLTSAGMVDRWTHPAAQSSRAVALWNDGQGSEREIVLEKGAVGILLSLSISSEYEISADGRTESYATNKIILGGIQQVFPQ